MSPAQGKRSTSIRPILRFWEPWPGKSRPIRGCFISLLSRIVRSGSHDMPPVSGNFSLIIRMSCRSRWLNSSGSPAMTAARLLFFRSASCAVFAARSASSAMLMPFEISRRSLAFFSSSVTESALSTKTSVSWFEIKSDLSSMAGFRSKLGAWPDSSVIWQLMPPNPMADTPARRLSDLLQISPCKMGYRQRALVSKTGWGSLHPAMGGRTRRLTAITVLINPPIPEAALVWPIIDFKEVIPQVRFNAPALLSMTMETPSNSTWSPTVVPVPCPSINLRVPIV